MPRARREPDRPGTYPMRRRVVCPVAYRRMVLEQSRDIARSAREAQRLAGVGQCGEAQRALLWAVSEMGDIGGMLYGCSQEGYMTEAAEHRLRVKLLGDIADAKYAVLKRCLISRRRK